MPVQFVLFYFVSLVLCYVAYGTCGGDCMKGMRSRHIQTCFVVILKGVTLTNVQLSLHLCACGLVVGIFVLNENGKKYFIHKCLCVLCTLSYYLVKSLIGEQCFIKTVSIYPSILILLLRNLIVISI